MANIQIKATTEIRLPHTSEKFAQEFISKVVQKNAKKGVFIESVTEGVTPKGFACDMIKYSNGDVFFSIGHYYWKKRD